MLEEAEAKGACRSMLVWAREQDFADRKTLWIAAASGYLAWLERNLDAKWLPTLRLTDEEYERGLADEHKLIRKHFAGLVNYKPTAAQYERGLTDEWESTRLAWARRTDITPTAEQYERGLMDPKIHIHSGWIDRHDIPMTPTQIKRDIGCPHVNVWVAAVRRLEYKPSEKELRKYEAHDCVFIRDAYKAKRAAMARAA